MNEPSHDDNDAVAEPKTEAPAPDAAPEETAKSDAPTGLKAQLRQVWHWIRAKRRRTVAAAAILLLVVGGGVVAATDLRYPVLGLVMKGSADITVVDASTKQPVPKALIEVGGQSDLTDKNGHLVLKNVTLGHSKLIVRKTGYDMSSQDTTVPVLKRAALHASLKPNGIMITTHVRNLITAGSVAGVEVRAGDASAVTDESGTAKLSLPPKTLASTQTLSFERDGYNKLEQTVAVKIHAEAVEAKLVPAGKVYFQSNRTGKIDIYESNLDGSAAKIVLAGTGSEDTATGILPNITDPHTLALVSSRDGRRGGGLHHDLFIFNTESQKLTKIDEDVEFNNFRAWVGGGLIYTKTRYNQFTGNCDSIKTYQPSSSKTSTLFDGEPGGRGCAAVTVAMRDSFIYSVTGGTAGTSGLYSAKFSGTGKQISSSPSNEAVRRTKQAILSEYYNYSAGGNSTTWDSVDLNSFAVTRLPNGPSIETSRYYNDSPDGSYSSFIEERDGKSDVYVSDGAGGNEKKLTNLGSANQFVQWYGSDYLVFSSTRTDENALYIIGIGGGTPVKIADFYRGNQRTYGGGGNSYY